MRPQVSNLAFKEESTINIYTLPLAPVIEQFENIVLNNPITNEVINSITNKAWI